MVEIMHNIGKVAIEKAVKTTNYIFISCDEVTSVDN
jgi:hypothetical protein